MIKIILMICGFAVCVITGAIIKGRYQRKEKCLVDFENFCESIKTQIAFLQTNLDKLIEIEVGKCGREFASLLKAYQKSLADSASRTKPKFLSEEEWSIIENMFSSLGKSDVKNQIALCENCKNAIAPSVQKAKEKNTKEGSMWFKVMFCLGFAVVVVLI